MCRSTGVSTWGLPGRVGAYKKEEVFSFRTYNILNSRNVIIELELRGMTHANVDLVILRETKIIDRVYSQESVGFCFVTSDTPSLHFGVMAIFYKDSLCFAVESHQHHGHKFSRFHMVTGGYRWHVVG